MPKDWEYLFKLKRCRYDSSTFLFRMGWLLKKGGCRHMEEKEDGDKNLKNGLKIKKKGSENKLFFGLFVFF